MEPVIAIVTAPAALAVLTASTVSGVAFREQITAMQRLSSLFGGRVDKFIACIGGCPKTFGLALEQVQSGENRRLGSAAGHKIECFNPAASILHLISLIISLTLISCPSCQASLKLLPSFSIFTPYNSSVLSIDTLCSITSDRTASGFRFFGSP